MQIILIILVKSSDTVITFYTDILYCQILAPKIFICFLENRATLNHLEDGSELHVPYFLE